MCIANPVFGGCLMDRFANDIRNAAKEGGVLYGRNTL